MVTIYKARWCFNKASTTTNKPFTQAPIWMDGDWIGIFFPIGFLTPSQLTPVNIVNLFNGCWVTWPSFRKQAPSGRS